MSSRSSSPRVSIGVPVLNGEKYLVNSLDSILNQSFEDFEVIISDNASTDSTSRICEQYARLDSRIIYIRNDRNLGASANFNRTFEVSKGEYFKWAAHDDVIAPEFLRNCVDTLDNDVSAVLVCPTTAKLDSQGRVIRTISHGMNVDSHSFYNRFCTLVQHPNRHHVFGLIRSSALRNTPLIESFADSDGTLLVELARFGRFVELDETLMFLRIHPESSTRKYPTPRKRAAWFSGDVTHRLSFPAWKGVHRYARTINNSRSGFRTIMSCYVALTRWIIEYRWRVLAGEVRRNALEYVFGERGSAPVAESGSAATNEETVAGRKSLLAPTD